MCAAAAAAFSLAIAYKTTRIDATQHMRAHNIELKYQ